MEFKILLAMKGVNELYGFFMKEQENTDRFQVNKRLFEMAKKEIVFADDNKFLMNQDIEVMLNQIIDAEKMVIFSEKSAERPESCIYVGKEAVCIQLCGQNDDIVRLERVALSDLPEKIVESGFCVEQLLADDTLYREEKITCPEIAEIAWKSFGKEKNEILKQNGVNACLLIFSMTTKQKEQQVLLIGSGMEDYITVSNGSIDDVYIYSEKKVFHIINQCIGEE